MYKKNSPLPVVSLVCSVLALIVSVIALLSGGPGADQSNEYPALEQQIVDLQYQVDALTAQLEGISQQSALADWNLSALAWEDGTGADVTLTAMPGSSDLTAAFCVKLDGQEVANVACTAEGGVLTATASLPAADGYSYYCILTGADGSRQQLALSTPENPVAYGPVFLQSSLGAYCNLTVDGWETLGKDALSLTSAHVEVQLPLVGSGDETVITTAELVLYHNGEAIARLPIEPVPGQTEGCLELTVTDAGFPLPQMAEEDSLELTLEVTLSNGQTLTTPGANWYRSGEELNMVVG